MRLSELFVQIFVVEAFLCYKDLFTTNLSSNKCEYIKVAKVLKRLKVTNCCSPYSCHKLRNIFLY